MFLLVTDTEPAGGLDIPYLGAEDVIEEVITLLARLENDRVETEKTLKNEQERVVRLNNKIDNLCLRRMTELPSIVQRGNLNKYSIQLQFHFFKDTYFIE